MALGVDVVVLSKTESLFLVPCRSSSWSKMTTFGYSPLIMLR